MTKHFSNIIRHEDGTAFVQIYEIDKVGGEYAAGKLVMAYETMSKGASASARKEIKKLEAIYPVDKFGNAMILK